LGLAVSLVILGTLIFLSVYGGVPLFSSGFRKGSFALALEAYDRRITETPDLSFRQRNALLDGLEKKAPDTEGILSVLKRRRAPVRGPGASEDREQYLEAYAAAATRARTQYPYSAQTGALAAEALVLMEPPGRLSEEAAGTLRDLAGMMNEGALGNLSLSFAVYAGAMENPAAGRLLPRELFTLLVSLVDGEDREKYLVNSCVRTLLEGRAAEAQGMAGTLFDSPPLRNETIRFGAEFFYDYGNFLRSAELFAAFTDDRSLGRQADALWLAGFVSGARGLWRAAGSSRGSGSAGTGSAGAENAGAEAGGAGTGASGIAAGTAEGTDPASVKARAFYNLAATAPGAAEAAQALEQLFGVNAAVPAQVFGVIRYSRLVPLDRALAILGRTDHDREGLFDLELLRRRSEDWTVDKTVAETWMLLNRHPADGRLFEWAVWYFDFQRRHDETAQALKNAGINRVEGPWSALHRAFAQVREHNLPEAEKTLRSIVRAPGEGDAGRPPGRFQQPLWQAAANLALVLEKQRNYQEALRYYEAAAGQLAAAGLAAKENPPEGEAGVRGGPGAGAGRPEGIAAASSPEWRDAARLQVRIAGLFRALGMDSESRRALDYALDLDPENLEARMEKRRLDAGRGIL
jgi:tetratricopeptide (TPR) repeat protein